MPFQNSFNIQPGVGVAGDFASANPRSSILSGAGKFVAGAEGLTVGLFCWHDASDDTKLNNYGAGIPAGFLHREQNALITNFLAESGGLIQPGVEVNAFNSGDFWVKNDGSTAVTRGMKAYVNHATGKVSFAASGSPPTGASFTGVVAAGVLTATSVTGTIAAGQIISGTGVTAGAYIGEQLSGTAGGAGTYSVIGDDTVASTTITSVGGTETKWIAQSAGAAGELIKMSSTPEG